MSAVDDAYNELFPPGTAEAALAEAAYRVRVAEQKASTYKVKAAERDRFKAEADRLRAKLHDRAEAEKPMELAELLTTVADIAGRILARTEWGTGDIAWELFQAGLLRSSTITPAESVPF